jgi:hypothetical protein
MINMDALVEKYYGFGGIMAKIEAGLNLAGEDVSSLAVDDLSPIDEFHTRGRESTLEVAGLANLKASDLVLISPINKKTAMEYLHSDYYINHFIDF